MRKITLLIVLILISVFVLGCKAKRVLKNQSKEVERVEHTQTVKSEEKEALKELNSSNAIQTKDSKIVENKSDIKISGKVDALNPMIYYNVVNGDTLNAFSIRGNADFTFKSSSNNSEVKETNSTVNNSLNSKENNTVISSVVEDVKSKVKEVQNKTVEVVKKDFTIGSYIVFLVWGVVIIIIFALILWLRKSTFWKNIITKIKNKI